MYAALPAATFNNIQLITDGDSCHTSSCWQQPSISSMDANCCCHSCVSCFMCGMGHDYRLLCKLGNVTMRQHGKQQHWLNSCVFTMTMMYICTYGIYA